MKYGVSVAWIKSAKEPKRGDPNWRWENKPLIANVTGDIRSVRALVQFVANHYKVSTVNIKIGATYSDCLGEPVESDVVAEIIVPCMNDRTGENWLLIEASEVIALIDSVR